MIVGSQCREKLSPLTVAFLASSGNPDVYDPGAYFLSLGVKRRSG